MQNVLKHQNLYLEGLKLFCIFSLKSIRFEHSESIDMHIEQSLKKKTYIIFFRCPQIFSFCRIVIKLRRSPQLLGFFFTPLISSYDKTC